MKHFSKKNISIFFLVVIILAVSTNEVKTNIAAPPAGGLSGDPGRTTCALIGCHFGTEYSFKPGDLVLNMGDSMNNLTPLAGQSYIPGHTYYVEIMPNLSNGGIHTRYGFQMTSLDAVSAMAGSFTILDASMNASQNLLGRDYISHHNASAINDWIFQWTAPPAGTGKITFYYACNIANGNGNNDGDSIYKGSTDMFPVSATGFDNLSEEFNLLSVFPNPAKDFISISFHSEADCPYRVSLIALDGRRVDVKSGQKLMQGMNTLKCDVPSNLAPGIYLLELTAGEKRSVRRIILI